MGDPEVDEHRLAVEEQDIPRFDVPVNDSIAMDDVQGFGQAATKPQQGFPSQWPTLRDHGIERGTGDVARDEIWRRAVDVGVKDGGDIGVADAAEGGDLASQAGACPGIVSDVWAQHLDRHGPPIGVQREMDDSHPALADLLEQPIAPDHREFGSLGPRFGADRLSRHASTVSDAPRRDGGAEGEPIAEGQPIAGCSRRADRARSSGPRCGS